MHRLLLAALLLFPGLGCRPSALSEVLEDLSGGAKKVAFISGGAVAADHPYARHAHALLDGLTVPVVDGTIGDLGALCLAGAVVAVVTDYGLVTELSAEDRRALWLDCVGNNVGLTFLYVNQGTEEPDQQLFVAGASSIASEAKLVTAVRGRILAPGAAFSGTFPGNVRGFTIASGSPVDVIATADMGSPTNLRLPVVISAAATATTPRQAWFGVDFLPHWYSDALFLDALAWAAGSDTLIPAERWVGIDIDDVFQPNWSEDVSERTVKMQRGDVEQLLDLQRTWSETIFTEPFRFNLGFNSGWFEQEFGPAPCDDKAGDRAFVALRQHFDWFDHMPRHEVATDHSQAELITLMKESKAWATRQGVLPHMRKYSVSPAHRGIDPPYEPLYAAWRQVWDVETTATTDTATSFFHAGIEVRPRQSCGVACYSDHSLISQVGDDALQESQLQVMDLVVGRRTTRFMTHQSGYARDRLASLAFSRALTALRAATTLRFHTAAPDLLPP